VKKQATSSGMVFGTSFPAVAAPVMAKAMTKYEKQLLFD